MLRDQEIDAQKSQFTQSFYRPSTLAAQDELKEGRALKPHYAHTSSYLKDIKREGSNSTTSHPKSKGPVGCGRVAW
jgi:hypothetical protein